MKPQSNQKQSPYASKQGEKEVVESKEAKKSRIRLTSSQLYDLYARLDINGDGELDMDEFMAVGKKLNFDDENLIVRAFKLADTSSSGKLDADEFLVAYEAMFNSDLDGSDDSHEENFIRCTRYGIDKSSSPAKVLFQTYTGTMTSLTKRTDYSDDKSKSKQLKENEWPISRIVDLMSMDSINNRDNGSNILWWIDISVEEVLPKVVSKIIQTFGLPADVDTCFYNEILSPERDSRIRKGHGKIAKTQSTPATSRDKNNRYPLSVESLSIFVQSMFLRNCPVVHEYGVWVDCLFPSFIKKFVIYVSSRISLWYNLSDTPDEAREWSLINAERSASYFAEDNDGQDSGDMDADAFLTSSLCMPSVRQPSSREVQAAFLLSKHDLRVRDPCLVFDNLSIHLLKFDNQSCTNLITVRKLDSEEDVMHVAEEQNLELEQRSKGGIMGRLMWGMFQKLYNVVRAGGATSTHGEMMDSSAYLANVIISLVHNYNMGIIGNIESWMDKIEADMNIVAVSKHIFHLRECEKICKEVDSYVRTFHNVVDDMVLEDPDVEPVKMTPGMLRREKLLPNVDKEASTGNSHMVEEDVKNFELSPSTMEPFYGEIGLRTLPLLLDGNEDHELKGSSFWLSQMDSFFESTKILSDLYDQKLDEKRNFWSFILTIVSIAQFPLAAMSAYWCMHVDNMVERDVDWWKEHPEDVMGKYEMIFLYCIDKSKASDLYNILVDYFVSSSYS